MEPNATLTKAAEAMLPLVTEKLAEKFASKADVAAIGESIDGKLAKMTGELTSQIADIKNAPGFVKSRGDWKIRSMVTGEKREMEYSLGRLLHCLNTRKNSGALPREDRFKAEADFITKTITDGSASAGGSLIPQEWTNFVIEELGPKVVFLKAGPTTLPMQHQVMNIPGLTNNATYTWLGENAPITESSPTTNNTPLTLHTLKGLTGISKEWMDDATPETDAALQANLVRGISRAADSAYFNGTGGGTQPTGLLNVSSIGTIGAGGGATNGSAPTLDDISATIYLLDLANAPEDGRTFFCHPRTVRDLRNIKDSLGRPILWTNPANALDMRLNGYPVLTTTQIPINQTVGSSSAASSLILVSMADMYVGQGIKSQGIDVAISEEALFANAEIAVRLLFRTDLQPGHAASIGVLTGIL